jgi:hypothetical protein
MTEAAATDTDRRSARTAQRTVEKHRVRAGGQAFKGADRRPAQRDGHAGRVDLGGSRLADGIGLDPAQQLARDRGPTRRAEPLGIGEPGRRGRESGPDDHRAHRHRSGPGTAAHLVHARDPARAAASSRSISYPGPAAGAPAAGAAAVPSPNVSCSTVAMMARPLPGVTANRRG